MSAVVLAVSGSLRKQSFTEKMLDLCIEGMGEGLEVHKLYPHNMTIGPCTSCWSCWNRKSLGVCVQKDDFQEILDVYKRADYFLLATPLYVFDFPATVKNMLDRFFIVLESAQVESAEGTTRHPTRFDRHPKTVLISSCGFPEIGNFDLLRQHFRLICEHMDLIWAGELLISAAGVAQAPKLFDRKYELIRAAGEELIHGTISPETTEAVAAPVIAASDYRRMATLGFKGGIMAKAEMAMIAVKTMLKPGKDE
jgi:putative NADPH-quinone reductase